jgi:DNA replication protein DnaC
VLIRRHRADDSVSKAIGRILRADLVVVDDTGLLPVGPDAAEGLYRLVDAAYEKRSVAVSSNLHPSGFDELMPKTLATATRVPQLNASLVMRSQPLSCGNSPDSGTYGV